MFASVTRQLKRGISTVKSVLAVAGAAAAVLDPRLSSYLREGEQLDSIHMVQLTLVRWIDDDSQLLEEREAAHRDALRELKKLRGRRDQEKDVLYARLMKIRLTFEHAFGPGTAATYLGLEPGLSAVEPLVLRRHARESADILSDPQFTTPEPVVAGIWESPLQYAQQIRDALAPFEATLDEVGTQERVVELAQGERTKKVKEVKHRLTWSIRLIEAIYRLSGQDFHAERLRLVTSSRSAAEDSGEDPVDEPIDAGEPAPGEEPSASTEEPESSSSSV